MKPDKGGGCSDCHHKSRDYSEDIQLVTICDARTKKIQKKVFLCSEHIAQYINEGFKVS